MAPTTTSHAYTSSMKGLSGYGCLSMGAVIKVYFSLWNAILACGVHVSVLGEPFKREVKGAATIL